MEAKKSLCPGLEPGRHAHGKTDPSLGGVSLGPLGVFSPGIPGTRVQLS